MPISSEYARMLPDAYAKQDGSTNSNMLRVFEAMISEGRREPTENDPDPVQSLVVNLADMARMNDIEQAYGKTLDYYGEIYGVARGTLDDAQYRVLIKMQIVRTFGDSTHNHVAQSLAIVLHADVNDIEIGDDALHEATVHIKKLPFDILNHVGLSSRDVVRMMQTLVAVGVGVRSDNFEGTFEFAAGPDEADNTAGFAISHEDQSIGGYLGLSFGDDETAPLPLITRGGTTLGR